MQTSNTIDNMKSILFFALTLCALTIKAHHEINIQVQQFFPWDDENEGKTTILVKTDDEIEDGDNLSEEEKNEIDDSLMKSDEDATYYPRSNNRVRRQTSEWIPCTRIQCAYFERKSDGAIARVCRFTPGYCRVSS